jgi:hypothetical protein
MGSRPKLEWNYAIYMVRPNTCASACIMVAIEPEQKPGDSSSSPNSIVGVVDAYAVLLGQGHG